MDDNNGRRYEPDRPKTKRKVVQSLIDHTYYNCSLVNVEEELARRSSQRHHKYKNPNRKGLTTNFPAKLHKILSNPEFRHIIRWMPHGRSWTVVNKDLLAKTVCKRYWNHESYESFNRSLNGWGFKRLWRAGPETRQYYHECFLRGLPDHTKLMERLVNPGKRIRDKQGEPNFWNIAKDFPLPPDPYDDEPTRNGGDYEDYDYENNNSVKETSSPHSTTSSRPSFTTRSVSLPTAPHAHGHGSRHHYHPYDLYPHGPHRRPPASFHRHSNSCPPASAHYDEHGWNHLHNHHYHQPYYPSAYQHYPSSTVIYNPYRSCGYSVNCDTSEHNSPMRSTNAHSSATKSNAMVLGKDEGEMEDERKPPADGGCEEFVAPPPLPETGSTNPNIDDADVYSKEQSAETERKHEDDDATHYNHFKYNYDEANLQEFASEYAKDD
ncbi:predicted protein [Thalassiosira pseudonana CCMP1335]|uniref:HSF-type DNA-binding domain-containing protein n=1 Tax=Thalassiosira pseudonana TaxID=35128 RepID=B8CGH8_THAPS|nr:predicted protein [Thalassiosira pseudonana CCMP1335]EED87499.1 predicted protein [Thalassiosira pseudonana CCMP1335]